MGRPANEVLDELEEEWTPGLRSASLAAELQLTDKKVRRAVRCLGLIQQHWPQELYRWPACIVVALSGLGALEYESGQLLVGCLGSRAHSW